MQERMISDIMIGDWSELKGSKYINEINRKRIEEKSKHLVRMENFQRIKNFDPTQYCL